MVKKIIPIGKAFISIKCGECIHFTRVKKFELPCKELGRKHFSDAPGCYDPDVYLLTKQAPDTLSQLALLVKDFSSSEVRVLMSLLKNTKAFEKAGYAFGQPVFFKIGEDYLSNYYRGFVLNVSSQDTTVTVTSDLNKTQRSNPLIGFVLSENIYSVSAFRKKKAQLVKQGREIDPAPKFTKIQKAEIVKADYVPPTMDNAPDDWFNKVDSTGKKKKKRGGRGLVFEV